MSYHPNRVARRGRVASIAIIVLFGVLTVRFFTFQVLQHASYVLQSDQNRLNEVPLPAPRGIIYDRSGLIIAENVPGYSVSILAPMLDSLKAILTRVGQVVPISKREFDAAVRRHALFTNRPTVVFGDASFQVVSTLEEHRVEFPGLVIQSTPKRFYPDSASVSGFVGYTREINEVELANDTAKIYKPGQQIGKTGIEFEYESVLRGTEGSRFVEVDAKQRVVREAGVRAELPPVAAPPLRTNIDLPLQRKVAKIFADSGYMGAAVVLDPHTGAVLALHSAPGYDPNSLGVSGYYASLISDTVHRPLYNKAVQGSYPPGSTWKLATAVMALERGAVKLDERMPHPCAGGYQIGNRWFHCWDKNGHGSVDLRGAIVGSCDVYFYQLGLRLALLNMVGGGRKFLFGTRTGIDLPNETLSDFPDTAVSADSKKKPSGGPISSDSLLTLYYNRKFRGNWSRLSEPAMLAIGQGSNQETVISMARFYTALATDGQIAKPKIVGTKPERTRIFQISTEDMQGLRDAMAGVTSSGGTAASAAIQGVKFAGKTGSAQNPQDTHRDHAWFVGFAPADDPKIVVAVFLEFGLHGQFAARVAKLIVESYLKTTVSAPVVTGD